MEGILLVPPDRGTIIGRAIWKPRYVVVGNAQRNYSQQNLTMSQIISTNRIRENRGGNPKSPPKPPSDAIYLSIYKSKDDWEAVQQHSITSVTDCSVQMIAHRKQGPVLPTLVIEISPDPTTDKLRKRRSSRTAGLTTTKDSGPTTLHFRPTDGEHSLNDWALCISSCIQYSPSDSLPMSPVTPVSPSWSNPFIARSRDAGEYSTRPNSRRQDNVRPPMHHSQSSHSHSSRDRPTTFASESPSLRSRRSDLSSYASSVNAIGMGYVVPNQHYTTVLPTDLPSPAATIGEFKDGDGYMLGWTAAQGRSSVLSSPGRGRASTSSHGQQSTQQSSSPPLPRETILDRAFQMRYIPGSDREVPGEEKLSSVARFEALMREDDERQVKDKREPAQVSSPTTSTWEEDDESEDDLNDETDDDDDDDESTDEDVFENKTAIGPSAQRALDYIASRRCQGSRNGRTSLSYHASSKAATAAAASILRPHTAHPKSTPVKTQPIASPPQLPSKLEVPQATATASDERPRQEKRHSTSSVKRLSFNEFTKRLSSTSSLLLVQTNASNSSSRGSAELERSQQHQHQHQQLTPRNGMSPSSGRREQEKCGWRGSVGVFGEGGFL